MNILGITAEYNPFHKGHAYQIGNARELSGADLVCVVMSGDFVQRGEPAIFEKRLRAESALRNGADLVLELPVSVSTASAETFAYGAVSILNLIGCTSLSYGCETGNSELLKKVAYILNDEPQEYCNVLRMKLKNGSSFPNARQKALIETAVTLLPGISSIEISDLLCGSNNILAIEYEKALLRLPNTGIKVSFPVIRSGKAYNDEDLPADHDHFASAAAIRNSISDQNDKWLDHIPLSGRDLYDPCYSIISEDLDLLLADRLLISSRESLCRIADIDPDLADRTLNLRNQYRGFESFAALLKNKAYTLSRIRRSLLHLVLNITNEIYETKKPQYIRVLGIKKTSSPMIGELIRNCPVPVITNLSDLNKHFPDRIPDGLIQDLYASNLYKSLQTNKYHIPFRNEYSEFFLTV